MSHVIVIAPNAATAQTAWAYLQNAGLAPAQPSRREQLTPQQVQALMIKTTQQHRSPQSAALDKIWTELATDLALGNVDAECCGWWQTLDPYTPAFWQRFDPDTRFVLVYEAPTTHAARDLTLALDSYAPHSIRAAPVPTLDLAASLQGWHKQHSQLLDTFFALGTYVQLIHTSQLVKAVQWLGLNVPDADCQEATSTDEALLHYLVDPVVAAHPKMEILWPQLQAAAQGPCPDQDPVSPVANQFFAQWLQQQNELRAMRLQLAQLNACHQSLKTRLSAEEKSRQLENKAKVAAQSELQTLQCAHAQKMRQLQEAQEAQEENELLLTQLHQVQEELENYFIKGQQQRHQYKPVVDFWRQQPPTDIWVDMRRTPDGHGWYEADAAGRWSGPGTESTVALPPLAAGQYIVEVQIANAMAPELVAGLQLCAVIDDGIHASEEVSVDLVHEFGPVSSLYPMTSTGVFTLPITQSIWHLRLTLPEVKSPFANGGSDTRLMGMHMQGLCLRLQTQNHGHALAEPLA